MKRFATATAILAGGLLAAAPLHAQSSNRPELVPYAGYMFFGDMLRGPVGTTLSNANGALVGAQLGLPIAGPLSLYANGSYARSDLTIGLPILGGIDVGETNAWMLDGGLQLRPETDGNIAPIIQLGAGASHYRISNALLTTESTNPVLSVGGGVDIQLSRDLGLRIMAKDHIGKFDFQEAIYANVSGRTAHNVGLVAGLRVSF